MWPQIFHGETWSHLLGDDATEKVYAQTFLELLNTGSNMRLISGDWKCHCAAPVEKRSTVSVIIEILFQTHCKVGPVACWTHPVLISFVPGGRVVTDIFGKIDGPSYLFPDPQSEGR